MPQLFRGRVIGASLVVAVVLALGSVPAEALEAGQAAAPMMELLAEAQQASAGCVVPPALVKERERLRVIGGTLAGICPDSHHTYGYHVPASRLARGDYSLDRGKNKPVSNAYASAIDIEMDWKGSRDWLRWLIREKREGRLPNVAEVIGSYDGKYVMYWSQHDTPNWPERGVDYYKEKNGVGHDTWTHVAIYRSTARKDARILAGWPAQGCGGKSCRGNQFCFRTRCCPTEGCVGGCPCG